jgi:hypothetical protein
MSRRFPTTAADHRRSVAYSRHVSRQQSSDFGKAIREGRRVAMPVNLSHNFEKLGGLNWQDILDLSVSFVAEKARSYF